MPPADESDTALCSRAAAGDHRAFGLLVARHEARVRSFLLHLAGADIADELAQDSFVRAWRSLHRFRGEAAFSSWVCAIGWRCFLDHLRRQKAEGRRQDAAATLADPIAPGAFGAALDLRRLLDQLNPVERACLILCDGHGYSHGEAADILRMPLGTLKSTVKRAKDKCREAMRADEPD